jgi:hypothetical protein
MNFFSLNGASINGSGVGKLVLASALLSCSASVTATINKVVTAETTITCNSEVAANGLIYKTPGLINILGEAYLSGTPKLTHAAKTNVAGTASILAYTIRKIDAEIGFGGSAELQVVVASTQGNSSFSGVASVQSEATRVQPAVAEFDHINGAYISSLSTVYRYGFVNTTPSCDIRAETNLNGVDEAYAQPIGTSEVVADAVCIKGASSEIVPSATSTAIGTIIQSALAESEANGFIVSAEPNVVAIPFVQARVTADLDATATITKQAESVVEGKCTWLVLLKQAHSVEANLSSGVEIAARAIRINPATALIQGNSESSVTGLRRLIGAVNATPSCEITAAPSVKYTSYAQVLGSSLVNPVSDELNLKNKKANVEASGSVDIQVTANIQHAVKSEFIGHSSITGFSEELNTRRKAVEASLYSSCDIEASSYMEVAAATEIYKYSEISAEAETLIRFIYADINSGAEIEINNINVISACMVDFSGTATVSAISSRMILLTPSENILLGGHVNIYADTVTNPEAEDPSYRVFYRLPNMTEFSRAAIQTEFVRV